MSTSVGTPDSPWLTVPESAKRARRSRHTILAALASNELVGHRRGEHGRWRVHVEDLDAWVRGEKADVQIQAIAGRRSA